MTRQRCHGLRCDLGLAIGLVDDDARNFRTFKQGRIADRGAEAQQFHASELNLASTQG
jgi:hypothetical protein